ncbi:hypothetical protein VST7929_00127 [Vibrio stylophorae]|uniref:Lysoplasmalogenase n=1 Tax=Vibrio stylophorae TaxID=659351 RepID=A0ABM8ZQ55_9VIBR|nr:lysoplasmalogenase [Vibrio stylophorae]CAH0532311.1 hypothetical protein VST7929_00127 [Vibrio stylophorae]
MILHSIAAIVAVGYLIMFYQQKMQIAHWLKPVPVVILAIDVFLHAGENAFYGLMIVCLLCSALADFWLEEKAKFSRAVRLYLLVHIGYGIILWSQPSGDMVLWLPAMLFATGIITYFAVLPFLGRDAGKVMIYILLLIQVTWAAGQWYLNVGCVPAAFAYTGTLLFCFSGVVYVVNRFRGRFKIAPALTMLTYYPAQACLAQAVIQVCLKT